jgi:hypothetical protein
VIIIINYIQIFKIVYLFSSGTQLEAFAAALYSSIHCTQGPPGTGKVNIN